MQAQQDKIGKESWPYRAKQKSRFFKPTILRYNWDSFAIDGPLL